MTQTIECYKCGAQNEFGQRFCTVCGEKFFYRCPQCNEVIEHGSKSCTSCGVKLDWGIEKQVISATENNEQDEASDTGIDSDRRFNRKTHRKIPWVAVFITIIVCIAAVFAIDTYMREKAPMHVSHKEQSEAAADIDLQITAEELSREYMDDDDMADAKYHGKILSVTGKITSISKNLVGTYFVKLSGGTIADIQIQCIFDKNSNAQLESLDVDETVTIQGMCDGAQAVVKLINCEIPVIP